MKKCRKGGHSQANQVVPAVFCSFRLAFASHDASRAGWHTNHDYSRASSYAGCGAGCDTCNADNDVGYLFYISSACVQTGYAGRDTGHDRLAMPVVLIMTGYAGYDAGHNDFYAGRDADCLFSVLLIVCEHAGRDSDKFVCWL